MEYKQPWEPRTVAQSSVTMHEQQHVPSHWPPPAVQLRRCPICLGQETWWATVTRLHGCIEHIWHAVGCTTPGPGLVTASSVAAPCDRWMDYFAWAPASAVKAGKVWPCFLGTLFSLSWAGQQLLQVMASVLHNSTNTSCSMTSKGRNQQLLTAS